MLASLILSVGGWVQDQAPSPPSLTMNKPIEGEVADSDQEIHTPTLDRGYSSAPVLGKAISFTAPTSAWYRIELTSDQFDAYLILRDDQQVVVVENDDGLAETHSLAMVQLAEGQTITVHACALHGERGPFQLSAFANPNADAIRDWQIQQALALDNQLQELYNLDLIAEGISVARQALELRQHAFGGEHIAVANSHGNLATFLLENDELQEALEHAELALKYTRKNVPADDLLLATPLFNLVTIFDLQLQYEKAAPIHAELYRLLDLHGEGQSEFSMLFHFDWGEALHKLGRYAEATEVFQRLYDVSKHLPSSTPEEQAVVQGRIGINIGLQGREGEAIPILQSAVQAMRATAGPHTHETAEVEVFLGVILTTAGQFTAALEAFKNAQQTLHLLYGVDSYEAGSVLNNLATLYQSKGDLESAIPLLEKSLSIAVNHLGDVHPEVAIAYNNLGMVFVTQGAPDEGIPYLQKAVDLRKKVLAPDHPDHAVGLINLGLAYDAGGDLELAGETFRKAVEFTDTHLGEMHFASMRARASLALHYFHQKDHENAEIHMRRSWQVGRELQGARHPLTLSAAQNVAAVLLAQGKAEESSAILAPTLQAMQEVLGSSHPSTILCQSSYANSLFSSGDYDQALPFYLTAHQERSQLLDLQMPTMSESARFQYLATWPSPEDLLDCAVRLDHAPLNEVYSTFLNWKGKATRSQRASRFWARNNGASENQQLVDEIQSLNHQIQTLVFESGQVSEEQVVERIAKLRTRRLELERDLNRRSGLDRVLAQPDATQLQEALSPDTALLDFFAGEEVYVWIIRAQEPPVIRCLGPTSEVQKQMEIHLQNKLDSTRIQRGGRSLANPSGETDNLFEVLWQPLQSYLHGIEKILISPDGVLCELPFAILQNPEKEFLLEKFQISYLADVSKILSMTTSAGSRQGDLGLIGNVNYFEADGFADVPLIPLDASGRIHKRWVSLPGTQTEIQAIQDLVQYVLKWQTDVVELNGQRATEKSVRELLPRMRYLHFATHGYFEPGHLPSLMVHGAELSKNQALGAKQKAVGLLPGLLSGLVLAGANQDLTAGANDAYLSAEEVSFLDLGQCELAVLSACETALGSSRAGNGLMSLRRAFEVAGAQTVISSLWKIGDKESADLMVDFYQHYWEKGMGKAESLRAAQLKMLKQQRAARGEPRPASWGAFVLSGNWK